MPVQGNRWCTRCFTALDSFQIRLREVVATPIDHRLLVRCTLLSASGILPDILSACRLAMARISADYAIKETAMPIPECSH